MGGRETHRVRLAIRTVAATTAAVISAAVISAAPWACGDRQPAAGTVVRDSAGVAVVEAPPEAATTARWRLELLRTVGGAGEIPSPTARKEPGPSSGDGIRGASGDGPWFRRISAMDLDTDGLLYVLDGLEKRITVLDPELGQLVRRFGRGGRGPGEFRSPSELALRPDGDVMVGERMPAYLHRIRPDGTHRSAHILETGQLTFGRGDGVSGARAGILAEWAPPDSGGLFVRLLSLSFDPSEPGRYALVRLSPGGRVLGELLTWSQPFSMARLPRLFAARWSWTSDRRGRLLVSPGERYEVRTYDASGRLLRILRRHVLERPVTAALKRRARREFVGAMRDGGAPASMLNDVASRLESATRLPALQGLWTATPGGELWVGIPMARDDGHGTVEVGAFDVYSSGGSFLARVPSPPGFVLHRIHEGRIYGAWPDELEVPRVAVFRLVRG